jgi:hypothetical protein
VKDVRNADRIKVICRDEAEMQLVKQTAQTTAIKGARVLRDQLFPIKVDRANDTVVLDSNGDIPPRAMEVLGKENEVTIDKIHWLSDKKNGKTYGSMVTKGVDAKKLLEERWFHLAGESASTNIFEPRQRTSTVLQVLEDRPQSIRVQEDSGMRKACAARARARPMPGDRAVMYHKAEGPTKLSVEAVGREKHKAMNPKLQTSQLNVGKKDVVQLSLMNDQDDQDLQQYAVLAIAEPYARMIDVAV